MFSAVKKLIPGSSANILGRSVSYFKRDSFEYKLYASHQELCDQLMLLRELREELEGGVQSHEISLNGLEVKLKIAGLSRDSDASKIIGIMNKNVKVFESCLKALDDVSSKLETIEHDLLVCEGKVATGGLRDCQGLVLSKWCGDGDYS